MFKYDGYIVILSNSLRKIVSDLLNEENYSGEKVEVEPPISRYSKYYKKYTKYIKH